MDAMQSYFDYLFRTLCGIPEITLKGETEDWEEIVDRAKKLDKYGLDWWTKELVPVLEQFVEASKGNPDKNFWGSWFKVGGGSGGPYINGHMCKLFAYVKQGNELIRANWPDMSKQHFCMSGWGTSDFTSGLSSAPFLWEYLSEVYPMTFTSGFIGVKMDEESVEPNIGWAILERELTQKELEDEVERFAVELNDQDKEEIGESIISKV